MADFENPYLNRKADAKEAGGLSIYLTEEIGDARLNCQHLKQALGDAQKLIAASSHRDHFYEVAGHLIEGIPKYLLKLEKSLDAVALAAGRLDYEEIKQSLLPEKVEELEAILKDVRIRAVPRRSDPSLSPKEAAQLLEQLSQGVEKTGSTDGVLAPLLDLLQRLPSSVGTEPKETASLLRQASLEIEFASHPKPSQVVARVREILGSIVPADPVLALATLLVGNRREGVMSALKALNASLSDEQLVEIASSVKGAVSSEENPYDDHDFQE